MRIKSAFFKKEFDLSKAQLIGQGNFAQVFRVFDSELNDSLAIRKVKKSESDLQDITKQKVINQQLRKVDNENILKIFDIIDSTDTVWYITQYCSGGSLWDVLNLCKDNRMGQKEGLECILQISKGVQQLHNHRITHRDLKPENILLKTKYIPGKPLPLIKLADFGLSTQKIIMETIAGTKEYIAPEQAKFHNYTNAVDVWSLGIICDQILHGNPFYSGDNNKEVFSKILKMPYRVRDESLRPSIKQLLCSLLKKKPYQRPIIAVIRKNIEKILEQIQMQSKEKIDKTERKLKSKSSQQNSSLNEISRNGSVEGNLNQSTQLNQIKRPQKILISTQKGQKIDKNQKNQKNEKSEKNEKANLQPPSVYFKRDVQTPVTRPRRQLQKAEDPKSSKIQDSPASNNSQAPQQNQNVNSSFQHKEKEQKLNIVLQPEIQKQIHITISQQNADPVVTPIKEETVDQTLKTDRSLVQLAKSVQTLIKSPSAFIPPSNEKITIHKLQKRKVLPSHPKKQEIKSEVMDLQMYLEKMYNLKQNILSKTIKLERDHSFIPNTHLHGQAFQQKIGIGEQSLQTFTKRYDFLNQFSQSQDYELRMIKGQNELTKNRKLCQLSLTEYRKDIKQTFFGQIDSFVDGWLDRHIK